MLIALHKRARTTPSIRAEIAASREPVAVLARRYNVTEATIRKWRSRDDFYDRPHTAHRLQTTLSPAQEAIVVELRKLLLLSLDDLLVVVREFINPDVSRSGLDRCLRRHGVGNLRKLLPAPEKVAREAFKDYTPGYLHIDVKYLPQMADETGRGYLFVAIDRATRWVFIAIKPNKSAAAARAFLKKLHKACPFKITRVLTDNGKESSCRLFGAKDRQPSGEHEFDQLCQALGIEHRLTQAQDAADQRHGGALQVRIAEILTTHRFRDSEDLKTTLHRYVWLYNHQLPQKALGHLTPMAAMKKWYAERPDLFITKPRDRPGPDT